MMILHLQVHTDFIINGEIIMDSRFDVGQIDVQIQLQQMQHERKQYGIVVIIINDIIELCSLREIIEHQIIGHEVYITKDCDDEVEIMKAIIGD